MGEWGGGFLQSIEKEGNNPRSGLGMVLLDLDGRRGIRYGGGRRIGARSGGGRELEGCRS